MVVFEIKRESGENPEQNPLLYFPLVRGRVYRKFATGAKCREGAINGISQKTCFDLGEDLRLRGFRLWLSIKRWL